MNCNNNLIKEGNSMKKLGVIFGGMSTENKVSCVSGASVIKNLNKEKYEIYGDFSKKNPKIFNENFEINFIKYFIHK